MKVALVTPPWENAWIPMIRREVERRGHDFSVIAPGVASDADVYLHGWLSGKAVHGARNVFFLRRYEMFTKGGLYARDWADTYAIIVCNDWIDGVAKRHFEQSGINVPVHLVYNAVDPGKWEYGERRANKKIGMACHVHPKKNLPLALQILAELDDEWEIHVAGEIQDPCTAEYLADLGRSMRRTIYLYGHIPREQLNLWWEDKGFCLSTSISEGNPNNVIEAMAKGIKPIVHRWPGAQSQFPPGTVFQSVNEAVRMIRTGDYRSSEYRKWVSEKFSLDNIKRAVDIALGEA